jgi:uncharacterized protein YdaU (DUF1376 family)
MLSSFPTFNIDNDPKDQFPWFKCYVRDILGKVEDMSTAEIGAYLMLLFYHWNHDCLPNEKDMARVVHASPKEWKSIRDKVLDRALRDVAFLDQQKEKARERSRKAKNAADARHGNA